MFLVKRFRFYRSSVHPIVRYIVKKDRGFSYSTHNPHNMTFPIPWRFKERSRFVHQPLPDNTGSGQGQIHETY